MTDNAPYYTSAEMEEWCLANSVEQIFIAPYRHESVGLVERYHRTLIDRIRKLRFIYGGSWADYVDAAVKAMNEATHSVTQYTPIELWSGTEDMRRKAWNRTNQEREYRNRKRRIDSVKFEVGNLVLVKDQTVNLDRFQPRWKGPYILTRKISKTVWEAKSLKAAGRGRPPILRFHVDQMQPFGL